MQSCSAVASLPLIATLALQSRTFVNADSRWVCILPASIRAACAHYCRTSIGWALTSRHHLQNMQTRPACAPAACPRKKVSITCSIQVSTVKYEPRATRSCYRRANCDRWQRPCGNKGWTHSRCRNSGPMAVTTRCWIHGRRRSATMTPITCADCFQPSFCVAQIERVALRSACNGRKNRRFNTIFRGSMIWITAARGTRLNWPVAITKMAAQLLFRK